MKHYGLTIAQETEITNLTSPTGTTHPAEPHVGEMFFRTDEDVLKIYTSAGWTPLSGPVYDISIVRPGGVEDGEFLATIVAVRDFVIQADGHDGYATTPSSTGSPGGDAVITLKKNGTQFGTMTFAAGSNALTSETIVETSFDVGDRLDAEVVTSNGIEDFSVSLVGVFTSY